MNACHRCGAAFSSSLTELQTGFWGDKTLTGSRHFDCWSSVMRDGTVVVSDQCKLRQIAALCRQHANPASNVGAHSLAVKVLAIIEGGTDGK